MCSQLLLQICRVDVNHVIFPHDPRSRTVVTEWNAKSASLIVNKPVKGDLPLRTKVEQQRRVHFQCADLFSTAAVVQHLRYSAGCFVVGAVLLVAPVQCRPVQVCNVPKGSSSKEVFFYKTEPAVPPFPW